MGQVRLRPLLPMTPSKPPSTWRQGICTLRGGANEAHPSKQRRNVNTNVREMRCLSFLSIRVPSTYHDWSDRRQGRNCSPLGRYISVHFALLFSASADIVAVDSPLQGRADDVILGYTSAGLISTAPYTIFSRWLHLMRTILAHRSKHRFGDH